VNADAHIENCWPLRGLADKGLSDHVARSRKLPACHCAQRRNSLRFRFGFAQAESSHHAVAHVVVYEAAEDVIRCEPHRVGNSRFSTSTKHRVAANGSEKAVLKAADAANRGNRQRTLFTRRSRNRIARRSAVDKRQTSFVVEDRRRMVNLAFDGVVGHARRSAANPRPVRRALLGDGSRRHSPSMPSVTSTRQVRNAHERHRHARVRDPYAKRNIEQGLPGCARFDQHIVGGECGWRVIVAVQIFLCAKYAPTAVIRPAP